MTISIPNSTWEKYYEACDFFLTDNHISRECTIVYPPKRIPCDNCIVKPVGAATTNVYRNGGPAPFSFGSCPLCGGDGYSETEVTDTVRLRIYWNRSEWIKIASNINVDDAEAMIIGFAADLPKIMRAAQILLVKDSQTTTHPVVLLGKPTPWGFGKDRYFMVLVKAA